MVTDNEILALPSEYLIFKTNDPVLIHPGIVAKLVDFCDMHKIIETRNPDTSTNDLKPASSDWRHSVLILLTGGVQNAAAVA